MRLINADELKEWVENWFEKNRYYHPHSKANNIPIPELYDILERMPTVDIDSLNAKHEDIGYEKGYRDGYAEALEVTDNTEPIRHGRWIAHKYYECSICGAKHDMDWYYCPTCGAKMDDAPTQKSVGKALETLEANDDIR